MTKEIKRIIIILAGFCLLFIGLIVYLSYFQVFRAEEVKNNSYNKRLWINEESILRGSISDRNGKTLVYSEKEEETYKRHYEYGRLYSHIIGYSYREYGKSALELEYNNTLLNISENSAINELKNLVSPSKEGNSIKLTIDHELQAKSRELLEGKKGSIIAMNPKTGEIYSMVSLPDFDVSNLTEEWQGISEDTTGPLINRAIQGLYAPGSTFKVITTMAALNSEGLNENYECTGTTNIDGYEFNDYNSKAHGDINLEEALAKSCNTYFVNKAIEIGKNEIGEVADNFMINQNIPFDLPVNKSEFPYKGHLGNTDIGAATIGQGKVLTTPLNMLLIASGIANGGETMKPTLVKDIISKDDKVIRSNTAEPLSQGTDEATAKEVKNMMVKVVESGTGLNAKINNMKVAGKTGTAENSSGESHAWFMGFAPADDPKIAVVVLLEEEGSTGGQSAAPIGRDIMIQGINSVKDY